MKNLLSFLLILIPTCCLAQGSIFSIDTIEFVSVATSKGMLTSCRYEKENNDKIVCGIVEKQRLIHLKENGDVYWHDSPLAVEAVDIYSKDKKGVYAYDSTHYKSGASITPFRAKKENGRIYYVNIRKPSRKLIQGSVKKKHC